MKTPDITKAQILAAAQAVLAVLVAFGVNLDAAQQAALLGLSSVVALAIALGDGIIRHGRSRALHQAHEAALRAPQTAVGGATDRVPPEPLATSQPAPRIAATPTQPVTRAPPIQ